MWMARRAFLPTLPPPPSGGPPPPGGVPGGPPSAPRVGGGSGGPPPSQRVPPSVRPPPSGANLDSSRISGPPGVADAINVVAAAQLLDRLAAADEAPCLVTWLESVLTGKARIDPTLAVRLLRAYCETGRVDRARELAASLPSAPSSWNPLDAARLAIERAILATM